MKAPDPESTTRLRAAYERALDHHSSSDRKACPDPEAMLALVEGRMEESDRLEILDHVMQCGPCRQEFELLRTVAAGRQKESRSMGSWLAAAASLVLLVGAGYGVWRGVGEGEEPVFRGPDDAPGVELVSPPPASLAAGGEERETEASGRVEFIWRSEPRAFAYVFEILGEDGETLLTRVLPDTSVVLELEEHPGLRGEVSWWVRTRSHDGVERLSEIRTLRLRD